MSTPEEQQRRHQEARQQDYRGHQDLPGHQDPPGRQDYQDYPDYQGAQGPAGEQGHQGVQGHQGESGHQDPYGTQTWQAQTWDTSHQPVHPPLGGVPGQPAAPDGWFRDEAQAPVPAQDWYPGPAAQQSPPQQSTPQQSTPQQSPPPQVAAPDGWFREEAPAQAPAPGQDWSHGAGAPVSADETAYLPPYPGPAQQEAAYQAPYPGSAQQEAAAYQPPYTGPGSAQQEPAGRAEESAYLPPFPGPAEPRQAAAPEGWFRDEAPAPAQAPDPGQDWSHGGTGAPWPGAAPDPAEQTAYLPPQAAAPESVEQTAYLPPYPGPDAEAAAAPVADASPGGPAGGGPAPVPAPGEEPAYSPPTLAGNTVRAVDPAQARAEGRSPVIDPGPQSAVLTAVLGVLLAVAALLGDLALLLPLIALQGLTAAGWFRLNGMWPARQGIALAFAGALVADAAVLAVDPTHGPGAIVGTLGAWVLLTLVLQLRSHADPDERMSGLMASVASAALAVVCAGYLAADAKAVTVGAAAVAVAVFARALPLPTAPSVGVSLGAAAGAGIALGGLTGIGAGGALLGLAAGVCALIGLRVAAYDYPSKFVHMTAGVAMPLAVAAPAVYLIGRVVA
ncbi:hypothetical protein ACFWUQ_11805 [Streptomyces sp. NPDC058662]|uniref:hypothetical protein n=1 Tax=Streptomyces sp. NPDC058662 TaxID=3346583 RepID=UPI0036689296